MHNPPELTAHWQPDCTILNSSICAAILKPPVSRASSAKYWACPCRKPSIPPSITTRSASCGLARMNGTSSAIILMLPPWKQRCARNSAASTSPSPISAATTRYCTSPAHLPAISSLAAARWIYTPGSSNPVTAQAATISKRPSGFGNPMPKAMNSLSAAALQATYNSGSSAPAPNVHW